MIFIRQRAKNDCGVACLAMLTDRSYEDALRVLVGWGFMPHRKKGTITRQHVAAAVQLGFRPVGCRLKPVLKHASYNVPGETLEQYDRRERTSAWRGVPDNSLVKVDTYPPHPRDWHWVTWRRGKIYDPSRGVFKPDRYDKLPHSYLRLVPFGGSS